MPILEEVRRAVRRIAFGKSDPRWEAWDALGDELSLPRQWVACPNCGQQGWRIPPHAFEPCPLVVQTAEAAGMKFDADRMAALRLGVQAEELTKLFKAQFTEEEEE